jgi:hypothetical protein
MADEERIAVQHLYGKAWRGREAGDGLGEEITSILSPEAGSGGGCRKSRSCIVELRSADRLGKESFPRADGPCAFTSSWKAI